MKFNLKFLFFLCLSTILFSSCVGLNNSFTHPEIPHTQVVLDDADFRVIRTVTGEWDARYIFGIGGISKSALQTSAISEMYKNAGLTGSQAIINIHCVVSKKSILGIVTTKKAICTGTIIEFTSKDRSSNNGKL